MAPKQTDKIKRLYRFRWNGGHSVWASRAHDILSLILHRRTFQRLDRLLSIGFRFVEDSAPTSPLANSTGT